MGEPFATVIFTGSSTPASDSRARASVLAGTPRRDAARNSARARLSWSECRPTGAPSSARIVVARPRSSSGRSRVEKFAFTPTPISTCGFSCARNTSTSTPATFFPLSSTSLGHFSVTRGDLGDSPESLPPSSAASVRHACSMVSSAATPMRRPSPSSISGSISGSTGIARVIHRPPLGLLHARPKRPTPPVCSLAMNEVSSRSGPCSIARRASSIVESVVSRSRNLMGCSGRIGRCSVDHACGRVDGLSCGRASRPERAI